jgi:hypothetical protein
VPEPGHRPRRQAQRSRHVAEEETTAPQHPAVLGLNSLFRTDRVLRAHRTRVTPGTPTDRGGPPARSVGCLASQRRRRALRAGGGCGRGQLHRAVPDGLRRPPAGRRGRPRGRDSRRRRLVFACLGIALALHGRRAIRARVLNVASVGASVFINVIAAAPGWRSLAVHVLTSLAAPSSGCTHAMAMAMTMAGDPGRRLTRRAPPPRMPAIYNFSNFDQLRCGDLAGRGR